LIGCENYRGLLRAEASLAENLRKETIVGSVPSIEEEAPQPPECDRGRFAARGEDTGAADLASEPTTGAHEEANIRGALGTPLLPLLGVVLVVILDRLCEHELGVSLGVTLLMVFPIFWAARSSGPRSGILVAAIGCLLWVASDALGHSPGHPRPFTFAVAGIHVAIFATAIALAMEQRRLIAERALATTDFLTGVANRRGFYESLTREIERSRRYRTPMTLLYLDCDEFKTVNDTRGHAAGNQLLVATASVLQANTRAADVVGRLGGDEFAVMLAETAAERSAEIVARLQRELGAALAPGMPAVTFSIGAITFDSAPPDPVEAIRIADSLMYEAKRAGKDRAVHANLT
jgi:diguanylate cyclase (GGDEF)-like protein